MTQTATSVTLAEFLEMPGHEHLEWIDGEILPMAKTSVEHAVLIMRTGALLQRYVEDHGLGMVAAESAHFHVTADGVEAYRMADVSFLAGATARDLIEKHPWRGAPDLVVEVVSRHDAFGDVESKVTMWLDNGARLVWVVSHNRMVHVYRQGGTTQLLREHDELDGEGVLPGFRCKVADLYP